MSANYDHQGGGGRRLMEKTILNFHFVFLKPSLIKREKNQLWWDFGFLDTRHRALKESKILGANKMV